ncbi:hypothetical protein [Geosporobacter ferrireducens]|uniref:Uncharacterized protein n=1 Tax=Geosporobacter ferrireducens TaxID=1424294 RepID=A0A1D8GDW5_9FIRM|nr:hypothetical protein [Geosporobacter ferrireducens]AOT69093.1 hypothetical protein Gferi_05690 [Geosporobacter ferrireducens]MTI56767.1 hypothetical protein [Geosporobacter ferrireducens]
MKNKKALVLLMAMIIFVLTFNVFQESKQLDAADAQKRYKDLAEEIELKLDATDIQRSYEDLPKEIKTKIDMLKTSENKELLDNDILSQYEPVHACHSGPEHQECKLTAGQKESCGCYGGMWYCCCGKKMNFVYLYCPKHRG